MRRALHFGLVLLTVAAAAAARPALASNPSDAQFFMNGASSRQGYLGVDVRDITADQVAPLKLRDTRGAEVMMVDHDAPAGKCGLREHDVILQMNGAQIEGRDQVRRILHELPPGRALQLLISRDGQQITLSTQMSTREEVEKRAWERLTPAESESGGDGAEMAQSGLGSRAAAKSFLGNVLNAPAYTGAMLEKMTSQLADYFGVPAGVGLLVRNVEPNSPAAQAGMHAGDVVVRAASRSVCNLNDWAHALKTSKNQPVAVTVLRDKKEQTLTLTLDPKRKTSLHRSDEDPNRLGFSFRGK